MQAVEITYGAVWRSTGTERFDEVWFLQVHKRPELSETS